MNKMHAAIFAALACATIVHAQSAPPAATNSAAAASPQGYTNHAGHVLVGTLVSADAQRATFRLPGGAARTVLVADGSCEGHIAPAARGDGGFGYDPLFVPSGWGQRTLGEASPAEKNELSHRAEAVRALRPQLRAWRIQMDADG